jgi:hypothetical protein
MRMPAHQIAGHWLQIACSLCLTASVAAMMPQSAHAADTLRGSAVAKANAAGKKGDKKATSTANKTVTKTPTPVLSDATRQAIREAAQKLDPETQAGLNRLSDAVHQEDRAVYNDLRDEEESSFSDIGMLWEAAVERSSTIRYAIEKLSRRDATGKPVTNDSFSMRMLQSLVHLGGVAGTMWTGTPAGLIGSNMIQDLMSGNPQDSALSRVTDADMVILAKEVDTLQSKLIEQYYSYRHAQERLVLAREATSTIAKYYDHASALTDSTSTTLQPLMQSIYDSSKQDEQNAQQAFGSARTELGLLVGPDALAALDQPNAKKSKDAQSATPTDAAAPSS